MRVLSGITIYPVKSLGGIAVQESRVERRGLRHDRRWMLVDTAGRFVSQREIPGMARLGTALGEDFLEIHDKDQPEACIRVPLEPGNWEKRRVEVWSNRCTALLCPDDSSAWLSDRLRQDLRLVYMPDSTKRAVDRRYAPSGQYVSFADGYPFLVIGQASLDDLNSRLKKPVPMNRFRPSLVFRGGTPYEEDDWGDFRIGEQPFRGVKPCARCAIPTIDQDSGQQGKEPLRTLSQYRNKGHKVLFGQNTIWTGHSSEALIRVGDAIRF